MYGFLLLFLVKGYKAICKRSQQAEKEIRENKTVNV